MNRIIFVGGIHGVGKSAVCKSITDKRDDLHNYSSSKLINCEYIKYNVLSDVDWNKEILLRQLDSL